MARRRWITVGLALAVVASIAPPAFPQDDDPIQLESDLVTVDLTATDARGEYVLDLKQEEIKVYDEGEPRELAFFERSSSTAMSRPLAIVLAIDVSGSIKPEEVHL